MPALPPVPFEPALSYSGFEAANPGTPKPGGSLDGDMNAIQVSISGLIAALADVRRGDGALVNAIVTTDSLSSTVLALMGGDWTVRGNWVTSTSYAVKDLIRAPSTFGGYVCAVAHTSGVFATDLAAGKWVLVAAGSLLANIPAAAGGDAGKQLVATGTDAYAWQAVTSPPSVLSYSGARTLVVGDVSRPIFFTGTVAATTLLPAGATITAGLGWTLRNAGTARLTIDGDAAETINGALTYVLGPYQSVQIIASGSSWLAIPGNERNVGDIVLGTWTTTAGPAPPRCLLPYGQAVSRTTYAAYFAEVGTAFGGGDGSTTFNMPDFRGVAFVAKDNMGGSAAGRVTTAGSGLDGTALGALGGSQSLPGHTHGITDPGHIHTLNNPSHAHGVTDPGHAHTVSGVGSGADGVNGGTGSLLVGTSVTTNSQVTGLTVSAASTAVTANSGSTGITVVTAGAGASGNVQPSAIVHAAIYVGV